MPNFDGTIDNTYRPDFESSQRRVREELREGLHELTRRPAAQPLPEDEIRVTSRELSFVPGRRKTFDPHDAQTRVLIRRLLELERLPHGGDIAEMISEWNWRDRMHTADQKQRYLEPIMEAVRRDPVANEARLIFLMLVFEPIRRSVTKALGRARSGLQPEQRDANWANRQEARLIAHIERERVYDITREAALEAIYRYPANSNVRLFLWMRETIAHRSLDHLKGELPQAGINQFSPDEAATIQEFLASVAGIDGPEMRDGRGLHRWRLQIPMRSVFETVTEFYDHDPVRDVCRTAIGRLPSAQREVIDADFFDDLQVPEIATRRASSQSTVYNLKARAQTRLEADNVFFSALCALDRVRDQARARKLAAEYPDGRLPDGRRIVHIGAAA